MEKDIKRDNKRPLIIVIPIFNDWEALDLLIQHIKPIIASMGIRCTLLIVNDGSTSPCDKTRLSHGYDVIHEIKILTLRRNLGHQRAITIGLTYVYDKYPDSVTLVMDGDGEDDPHDIPRLVETCYENNLSKIIFAERVKRMEGPIFCAFYHLYRYLHLWAIGLPVRIGNYSVIPFSCLKRLIVISEMWNHYAAAVLKARVPFVTIPTTRAKRLTGKPKMNFVALVIHGLSAISIFGEVAGIRVLIALVGLTFFCLLGGLLFIISGIAINMSYANAFAYGFWGILSIIFLTIMSVTIFVILILAKRTDTSFLPIRDYGYFIEKDEDLHNDS